MNLNTAEDKRLADNASHKVFWKKWGPYLSERQWGTVREDYSADGAAWEHFPHDHARSRVYRWGEDGGRHIGHQPGPVFLRRPLERTRPDPQGAAFRIEHEGRQPRRRRQRALLLSRQHADPLLHEVPLQISPGRIPLSGTRGHEQETVTTRP